MAEATTPTFEELRQRGWLCRRRGPKDIPWDYRSRIRDWQQTNRIVEGTDFINAVRCGPGMGKRCITMYDPAALDREFQKDIAGSYVDYKGHRVEPKPPSDGIRLEQALKQYHISVRYVWRLSDRGELLVGVGKPLHSGNREIFVSRRSLQRHVRTRSTSGRDMTCQQLPEDRVPVDALARELGVAPQLLRRWCRWRIHPGLGRQMRNGIGNYTYQNKLGRQVHHRGLLVSRSDATTCVDMFKDPIDKRIPGNPGKWTDRGIFTHENGDKYVTVNYLMSHKREYGLYERVFGKEWAREKLRSLTVILPGRRWRVKVYLRSDAEAARTRRLGKIDGGEWIKDNEIWQDAKGELWYSSAYLCRELGITYNRFYYDYHMSGKLSLWMFVLPKAVNTARLAGRARVYHQSQVRPLLGKSKATTTDPAAKKKGGRPRSDKTAEVQRYCYERYITDGAKAVTVRTEAGNKFGHGRAPKNDSDVRILAGRWAKDHVPPLPMTRKKGLEN
jgi:hypothetical protein